MLKKIQFLILNNFFLFLILILASFLRLFNADFQSLWDDEIVTMIESNPYISLRNAYHTYINYDNMPPLYFITLRCVFLIFGYTSLVLRCFSAIIGILSVFGIYKLGKELVNKKTGLIAASLLCVNFFHINYSQEGRPYSFLVLFTILSFLYFVKFLKTQKIKDVLIYTLFSSLMIQCQFFALSIIIGQFLVFCFFYIQSESLKKSFLIKGLLSAILLLISYIPAFPQLFKNYKIKSSWIETPKGNEFSQYLGNFFGDSEMILPIIYILIITFFIILSFEKNTDSKPFISNPLLFSFIIIISWLFFSLLFPLVISYLAIPVLVPRYFIHLIPALILILAITLDYIKNQTISYFIFFILIIFSLNDLLIIKNYFKTPTKPEYRAASKFVTENIKKNDEIVSKTGLHYKYFFDYNQVKNNFYWESLENYTRKIIKENVLKPFWYLSVREENIDVEKQLDTLFFNKYYINMKYESFQTFALKYESIPDKTIRINFNQKTKQFINNPIVMDVNSCLTSQKISLNKGFYSLFFCAKSLPENSINNINAHLTCRLNGKIIGGCFLNNIAYTTNKINFYTNNNSNAIIELCFDNDFYTDKSDRNAIVISTFLENKNN